MNLGAPELLIILAVVLLVFGSSRVPKLARSLGQAQKEFHHGIKEGESKDGAKAEAALAVAPDDKVTMTRAELDALLAQKDAAAKAAPEAPSAS